MLYLGNQPGVVMARIIGGIVAGLAIGLFSIWAIEMIGHLIYPLPAELNIRDPEQIETLIRTMPFGAQAFVVAAWFGGALIGSALAMRIAGRAWAAWLVAGVVAAAGIINILFIPHPVWMQISAVAAPLLGGLLGIHLGRRKALAPEDAPDDDVVEV